MPGLIIWKNRELDKMKRDIERLMSRLRNDFSLSTLSRLEQRGPYIELSETADNLIVKAEIPGIDPENLEVSIIEGVLTIRGETKDETTSEENNYHVTERRHESFSRSIQLPCKIEITDIEATYKEGTLVIVMPKCKPDAVREIKIKVS